MTRLAAAAITLGLLCASGCGSPPRVATVPADRGPVVNGDAVGCAPDRMRLPIQLCERPIFPERAGLWNGNREAFVYDGCLARAPFRRMAASTLAAMEVSTFTDTSGYAILPASFFGDWLEGKLFEHRILMTRWDAKSDSFVGFDRVRRGEPLTVSAAAALCAKYLVPNGAASISQNQQREYQDRVLDRDGGPPDSASEP